jgi:hypothetical protein
VAESWVKVAAAPDESVALLMDGVLKHAGISSLIQRAPGFDAPDSLAAGPRDVLVPGSLVEEAKRILEDTTGVEVVYQFPRTHWLLKKTPPNPSVVLYQIEALPMHSGD